MCERGASFFWSEDGRFVAKVAPRASESRCFVLAFSYMCKGCYRLASIDTESQNPRNVAGSIQKAQDDAGLEWYLFGIRIKSDEVETRAGYTRNSSLFLTPSPSFVKAIVMSFITSSSPSLRLPTDSLIPTLHHHHS